MSFWTKNVSANTMIFICCILSFLCFYLLLLLEADRLYLVFKLFQLVFLLINLVIVFFWLLAELKKKYGDRFLVLNKVDSFIYDKTGLSVILIPTAVQCFFKEYKISKALYVSSYLIIVWVTSKMLRTIVTVLLFLGVACNLFRIYTLFFELFSSFFLPLVCILPAKFFMGFFYIKIQKTGHIVWKFLFIIACIWFIGFLITLLYNILYLIFFIDFYYDNDRALLLLSSKEKCVFLLTRLRLYA